MIISHNDDSMISSNSNLDEKEKIKQPINDNENEKNQKPNQDEKKPEEKKKNDKKKTNPRKDKGYGDYLQAEEETSDQPPLTIVVQGPKQSGKTTLIKSLVKHYTKHSIQQVKGTITVRASKYRRVTFIECPNDINGMIDLSKVADLALILIDASIGFEMETFEYISLLKSHGFPNVMGVLTHMDFFKDSKQLRKTRKKYKKRFEHEVGNDYKLFYLSGMKFGTYPKLEISNLARFISIIKYATVPWKANHPFIIPDRYEHGKEGQKFDDNEQLDVSFYGWIRGASYGINNKIHIIGLGDYEIGNTEIIEDPVPILEQKVFEEEDSDDNDKIKKIDEDNNEDSCDEENGNQQKKKKKKRKRTLKQQEKIVYAPFSNLGFLNYEKSGGYITIPDEHVVFTKKQKKEQFDQENIDEIIQENEQVVSDQELEEGVKMVRELQEMNVKNLNEQLNDNDDVELIQGVQLNNQEKKQNLTETKQIEFLQKQKEIINLRLKAKNNIQEISYAVEHSKNVLATDLQELIYVSNNKVCNFDSQMFKSKELFTREQYKQLVKKQFMAGTLLEEEQNDENEEQEDDQKTKAKKKRELEIQKEEQEQEQQEEKKAKNQQQINAFLDSYLGLYKKGSYVKITIKNIKYGHFRNFDPTHPLVLCRINPGEDNFGYLKVRIKKHRWYNTILKTMDPLVFSIGWRRYQSIPYYVSQDNDTRLRYLKYTPQHDFCYAILYGNFAPQGTGFICTQSLSDKLEKFRLAATGEVLELNHNFEVLKKLKLIGEPFKIYKNSAFIKGMFNSNIEVSKFEGAQIKTPSGIRGQIKKAVKEGQPGSFRATFEDKLVASDLVFLRTWYKVELEKFYNPILSYEKMRLMKTTWELRKQLNVENKQNENSQYQDIVRTEKKFKPLMVSKNLEENLPFKSKEKVKQMSQKEKILKAESKLPIKQLTSEEDKKIFSLIQRLNTIKKEKIKAKEIKVQQTKIVKQARQEGETKKFQKGKKDYDKEKYKQKFSKKRKNDNNQYED
ncbi:hypothetical protein IMG5_071660 [Ichthyophthirius multifiliis]|uniref:Bms1-type G domain-containing protein n=1 Tax=Ichthyophthirius multifiliis TaxID=5932 RepID=G0QPV4_ICHMU|nr:hypothetical protein IMG5_071660 [Ichthyophthirius multifiliis]EGR32753.1 hypothetical protein IMG5_071660 [Ichthyophthirius multifiliis]|eukprot:XP_004036739.1 hypothetical protein IMG5_071660 [Ichthyophthirius multifiliis]